MSPSPTPSRVRLLVDVETPVGTFVAGTHVPAMPEGDGWLLHLSLPNRDGVVHLERVPGDAARYQGQRTATMAERKLAAHEDYQFARTVLHYDDEAATLWLQREYQVSLKTLRTWGFTTIRLEAVERAVRERKADS